jgi:putative flippase GtrA
VTQASESIDRRGPLSRLLKGSSDSAIFGQGFRFALVGGSVTLIYLLTTLLLADVVGLPFEVALPIGYCLGLVTHFTLQRVFVWVHPEEFALSLHHQAGRYLVVAGVQYGLTAASTAILPSVLGVPTEPVYIVTVAVLVCMNFFVFRHRIFHAKPAASTEGDAGSGTPDPQ